MAVKHKVFFLCDVKTVEININKTFAELERQALELFAIPEDQRDLHRLRIYNKIKDEMMEDFTGQGEMPLKDLKLNVAKNLIIETRKPGESFEPYLKNAFSLNLEFFNDKAYELDHVPVLHKLVIDKNASLDEFENQVRLLKGVAPQDQLHVCLKKTLKNGLLRGESIRALSVGKPKTLSELGFYNGMVLYADHGNETSQWERLFEEQNNMIVVNFNFPVEEGAG